MKTKNPLLVTVFATVLLIGCSGGGLEGTYVDEKRHSIVNKAIEFSSDGSCIVHMNLAGEVHHIEGEYKVSGNIVTIENDNGKVNVYTLESEDLLVDSHGYRLKKRLKKR